MFEADNAMWRLLLCLSRFSKGEKLRETGIPICKDKKGNRYIEDEDVIIFLKTQLKRENLTISSYWTI